MLSKGKVDVPIPMHIGIDETSTAGPETATSSGYISGTTTWTVKLANVSFYKVRTPFYGSQAGKVGRE